MIVYVLSGIIVVLVILLAMFLFKNRSNGVFHGSSLMSFVQDEEKPVVREHRTEYYEDGRAVKFLYECVGNDKDGKEELYYPSGKLNRVRNWKRGALDGEMIVYHSNGNVYIKGCYKKGSLIGEYAVYRDNGDLLTIKHY